MSARVKVRVTRPMMMRGERQEVGIILSLSPSEAASVLESGRGQLLDPADAGELQAARRAEVAEQMGRLGRLMPNPGSPWFPIQ
jgi:hypothetical protein